MKTKYLFTVCLIILQSSFCLSAHAQGTAFTYQGRLNDGTGRANGIYNFRSVLFDALTVGNQVGSPLTNAPVNVSNGLFTVTLDFGAGLFTGANRWLEIGVRPNGGGAFNTLTPRQALAAAPYAVYAANAGVATSAGAVFAANIVGTLATAQLPANLVSDGASGVNLTGTFSGSGAGLTGVNLMYANSYGAFQLTTNYDGGNFVLIGSPAVDSHPQSITTADVNGDGRVDLICANAGTNTLSVLTNNGNGSFTLAATLGVGLSPYSVTTADVNNDGQVDLISANFGNSLSVLTNNGTGGFVLASTLGVSQPFNVGAADLNGDGHVDLVCVNAGANTLTVFTNNGIGGFALASTPATGNAPRGLAIADVNGDGKLDLINGGLGVSALSVLTNHGNGSFTLASSPGVGAWPLSVVAADVNTDGKMDLISANYLAGLSVLTNNGAGLFTLASSINLGTGPRDVTAADVNGDGKVDLISANQDANTLSVLTNNGSGSFTLVSSPGVGHAPLAVLAADVNGDGARDLVSANNLDNTLSVLRNMPFFNSAILAGTFRGNGAGVSNVNAATLNGVSSGGFWQTGGNAGTTPGTQFLGTTDNQPLDFRVNYQRGLRLEYGKGGFESVNVIGGSGGNVVGGGVIGATIAGGGTADAGLINQVLSDFGTVGGGWSNTVNGASATIGGGNRNLASGSYATIGGGYANSAITGQQATVGGGSQNIASGNGATVPGGQQNTASANAATVAGGKGNVAHWDYATVGGGNANYASGEYATVPGGRDNAASHYAFAAGRRAKAAHTGAFVWADSTDADFTATATNQFLIRAAGGVGINTPAPGAMLQLGDVNTPNSQGMMRFVSRSGTGAANRYWDIGVPEGDENVAGKYYSFVIDDPQLGTNPELVIRWDTGNVGIGTNNPQQALHVVGNILATGTVTGSSDRNAKEHFAAVSPRAVLDQVAALPISRWNYKAEAGVTHVGPMAQDFFAAFAVGMDDTHISMVDADGVALAAIQGLNEKVEDKDARIAELERQNQSLELRLAALEKVIGSVKMHATPNAP